MKRTEATAKPFIKWAGGKGQLLNQLDEHLPQQLDGRPFTYVEPFVGGGAMLFHMLRKHPEIRRAVINDINAHLITAYRVIKERPLNLIERLSAIEQQYFALANEEAKKNFYLDAREIFNEEKLDDVDRTKYLIFLNRTCFNGLYRENSKGKFNVPFGRYLHPTICNSETIMADSDALNCTNVTILNGDFSETLNHLDEDGMNFIYFDPPYRPLNATSSFNSYVKEAFNDNEQIRLRDFSRKVDGMPDVYWMLSNSDCSAKNPEDTFFETIYDDFYIHRVYASRAINANPAKRGKLTELLICNYMPEGYSNCAAEEASPYHQIRKNTHNE
ncbi:MAG: DNA adenine methylase [Bacteroidales bacterium]|nr:DNA adenine methylase [Bacteroidales bacterium]